jgi:UDP-N-acetylmuramoyl-tripeptide--D-alanyl-D-alanine ligase
MFSNDLYNIFLSHPSVQTDTRKLKSGDLFFALKGANFNGNQFAAQALEAGAAYAIIDEEAYAIPGKTILVNDVLQTLQQLALHHRRQLSIPFIAITGSNGKTTTKELVHAVLSKKYRTYTTEGNLNNHIGIPLTLLKVKPDAEMAVVEMGANHQREIAAYCTYTEPSHGLITNVGKAHLEGFGGLEGVRKGKGELFDYLRTRPDGLVFVNWDYDYLQEMSQGIPNIIKYGTGDGLFVKGTLLQGDPFLHASLQHGSEKVDVQTQLVGAYNLPNLMAAAAVGLHFGVGLHDIRGALENYVPSNSRSQMLKSGPHEIILDAYNANPSSMRLAIENLARTQAAHKVLILGAMAELGEESIAEHQGIVDLIGKSQWEAVALVGGDFQKLSHPYLRFDNAEAARQWWQQAQLPPARVLIKGSRSMQMETVLKA